MQEPLTDEQIRIEAIVNSFIRQRDNALSALAQAEADLAVLTAKLKALEVKPEES